MNLLSKDLENQALLEALASDQRTYNFVGWNSPTDTKPVIIPDMTWEQFLCWSQGEWPELLPPGKDWLFSAVKLVDSPSASRLEKFVSEVSCLILDIDQNITIEKAMDLLEGFTYFLYTTRNHHLEKRKSNGSREVVGKACDRFRIVLPLSENISAKQYKNLWLGFTEKFFEKGEIDQAPKNPASAFFHPKHGNNREYKTQLGSGQLIDPEKFMIPEVAVIAEETPIGSSFLTDEEILEKAHRMSGKSGQKFCELWGGDSTGYTSSSEADLALCSYLGYWTRNNDAQTLRLMLQSQRKEFKSKDQQGDYQVRTVKRGRSTNIYTPPCLTSASKPEVLIQDFSRTKLGDIKKGDPFNIQRCINLAEIEVRRNLFTGHIELHGLDSELNLPLKVCDLGVEYLRFEWHEQHKVLFSKQLFNDYLNNVGLKNSYHPIRNYLDSLTWDGKERLNTWLIDLCGAEDTPYVRAVGRLWLLAAVRRVRHPGCKFDEMLVLENPVQGTLKSLFFRALAVKNEWADDNLNLKHTLGREVLEDLQGHWIVEAGEMKGLNQTDVQSLKAFLSRQEDRGRMSYDRYVTDWPRQCVFVGTTNQTEDYLRDSTGNRRFWPVRIQRLDLTKLYEVREQLWAEASEEERQPGTSIRLDPKLWELAGEEQEKRREIDPFEEVLAVYLESETEMSSEGVWNCLEIKIKDRHTGLSKRRMAALRQLGWERFLKNKVWFFRKVGDVPHHVQNRVLVRDATNNQ